MKECCLNKSVGNVEALNEAINQMTKFRDIHGDHKYQPSNAGRKWPGR